ncbi:hypothetical protein DGG96_12300 [Legionella qingyii]|uniref:Uncharacterized protein n=1 Tax=Legionella qingyii TaxID=2184757 RepID=A0A317U057_9GAMM|nr:hypothetical protein [Legionella qingyii]PWY55403.1 hypothetical protein DGG96_12300 [Legionella qingyii]RUR21195.1 hypothetical protein ELY20_12875 [Legionella qingyii]RUR24016.1 hypothetical protein ELY16_12440 [Legionella qingyii]
MDTIQFVLDAPLKRTIQNPHRLFFKQQDLSEANHPLLVSYLEWLRKINTTLNKRDVIHQNEQKNNEFKFLCKYNLLFFLTVTRQFNIIEKLFKIPSFIAKLRHSIALTKKMSRKVKQKKWNCLSVLFAPKIRSFNLEKLKRHAHDLSDMNQIKIFHQLSPELKIKKMKTLEEELENLMLEYCEDELCIEKPHNSTTVHTDCHLTFFTKFAKQSINIKNRPFMAQRLTFFSSSPQYKLKTTKHYEPIFNLNEQKTENNIRV